MSADAAVAVALVGALATAFAARAVLRGKRPGAFARAARAGEPASSRARDGVGDGASDVAPTIDADHAFLLARCAGDEGEVFRRLEAEIRRNPSLDEREAYRRAVRTWFLEARGGTHGTIGEGVEDVWL